jgi:hypothetical protein
MITEAPVIKTDTLTAQDRCDGCGSQAYVKVEALGSELLFCKHHWERPGTRDKLEPVATKIVDETWKLEPLPITD